MCPTRVFRNWMNSKKAVGVQDEDTKLKKKYSTKIKIRAYSPTDLCVGWKWDRKKGPKDKKNPKIRYQGSVTHGKLPGLAKFDHVIRAQYQKVSYPGLLI